MVYPVNGPPRMECNTLTLSGLAGVASVISSAPSSTHSPERRYVRRPMPEKFILSLSLRVFDGIVASVARSHRTKPNDVMNMSPMLAALSVTIDSSREFVIARRGVRERSELPCA